MRSGGTGLADMYHDFLTASLSTQLLIDVLVPPIFICFSWIRRGSDAWLWGDKTLALSLKESKFTLAALYALLFGLTIYGRFFYRSH